MKNRQAIRKGFIVTAFILFPIVMFYFSPYIIVMGAAHSIAAGSFVVFATLFVLSVFLGRYLCGYICPMGGMQECLASAKNKRVNGRKTDWIKYAVWVPWIIAIAVLFIRTGGISKVDMLYHIKNGVSLTEPFTYFIYFGVILIVMLLSFIVGKRGFCHCLCWISPFMVLGNKLAQLLNIPHLHLVSDKDKCSSCLRCTRQCPMSLEPATMAKENNFRNSECILCGECADSCPHRVIQYSFKRLTKCPKETDVK